MSSAEYNQKAGIIEDLRAERSQTEIIRIFGCPRSIIYDVAAKYLASETSEKGSANSTRKSYSKEKSVRIPAIIEKSSQREPRAAFDEISKNGYE